FAQDRALDATAKPGMLEPAQQCVQEAYHADDDGNVEISPADGEMVADQQSRPGEEVAALPDTRLPLASRLISCFSAGLHAVLCPGHLEMFRGVLWGRQK